jgi:hypothetical protein
MWYLFDDPLTNHLIQALGLGLWGLMPFSTIFQLYHGGQFLFFGGEKGSTRENHRLAANH